MRVSAWHTVAFTWLCCVTLTAVVFALEFDLRNRRFHVGLETADAMVLVFVAAVLLGRFRADGSRRSLLLLTAVILLAAKNLFFAVATMVLDDEFPGRHFSIWATAVNGLIGAALLAAAARLPDRRLRPVRPSASVLLPGMGVVAVVTLLAVALGDWLPRAFPPLPPSITELELLTAHPAKIAVDALTAVCYGIAAVAFARLADEHHDELMRWISVSAAIAAVAFVNYVLVPSRFTGLLYAGELLWICAVGVLLYGAVREIANVEAALVQSAVLDERKRVARDLHDGVAQELAYISSQAHWFLGRPADLQPMTKIMEAVERALDESRGAIASLNRPLDEPLGVALEHAALEIADRVGARLRIDLDQDVEVKTEWRDALLRIAREAVGNAVRHGHARTITLRLRAEDAVSLRIDDDGDGFDVSATPSRQSFGLVGMRERTESLGGRFTISSTPGTGTTVEVLLP